MPRREDDDVAPGPGAPRGRTLTLSAGFALAAAATLAVFLTDNPQYLRVAVVAVAWAFVIASFAAGRRSTDRAAAAVRERELRRAYRAELDREVTARHEYELELENELRRETEDAVRYELAALRTDIAALSGLREEVARVSQLRGDIASLTSLRDEVSRVAALRDDLAALNSLREELGQLAELRADMGRLRAELTEQLSSEMLVERIVMRTQASRMPAEQAQLDAPARTLDGWADDVPPRELTGGWPAVRLDEPRETRHLEQVRVESTGPRPPVPPSPASWPLSRSAGPATSTFAAASPPLSTPLPVPEESAAAPRLWSSIARHEAAAPASRHAAMETPPAPPTTDFPMSPSARAAEAAARPAVPPTTSTPVTPPAELPPPPMEWQAPRTGREPQTSPSMRPVPYRRRRDDGPAHDPVDPEVAPTTQRPAVQAVDPPVRIDDRGGYRVAVRDEPEPEREPTTQGTRVAEILAENGASPASGGRRRRRYRDEDQPDDVLARVLRQN